uniref:Midasin n=1 Tax=Leersia perrieri TaxID=77586 RepID=A0A0D9XKA7_9ORYZ
MSLDGSFSTAAAVARLLARCPALRSDPRVLALASPATPEGGAAAAGGPSREDVAAALAEPLLHPRYTIPVLGCFLPLAPALLDRAVELLRSAAPALRSDGEVVEEEAGEGDVRVVEFYLSRGRGLRLHELACLALARALDLAPYLLRYLLNYFKFAPPPFQRFLPGGVPSPIQTKGLHLLLDATQVSYRLLELEPRVFCEQWDWSCFLDLVYSTSDYSLVDNSLYSVVLDLRWCAIQILMVVLKASDEAVESFGLGADEAFTCFLRWKEFCTDTSLEKASLYLQAEEVNFKIDADGLTCLSDSLLDCHEFAVGRHHSSGSNICPFVPTATLRKSYEVALMAVNQKWPILLYGPVGAGKTALINRLAQIGGNRVLFIHMDEQMDGRTLIGSYVCTEKPGEFKWAPGSLTQAVIKGFWIVFEDIDKAPSDVQSILLPLLEGSSTFSIGHAEAVEVAENFRLFATVTTSKNDVSHALEDTFEKSNSLVSYQFGGLNLAGASSECLMQRFSLRDLLKWCKRICGVDLNFKGLGLSSSCCKLIYFEALIQKGPFADILRALEVLERVACSIKFNEPVLLVGETGTGKTTLVQNLASWLKQPLTVVNLSQQSDISDLLGGFKPADARSICFPLYTEFKDLFCRSFSGKDNEAILRHCDVYVMEKKWKKLLRALAKCVEKAQKLIDGSYRSNSGSKRKRPLPAQVISDWDSFSSKLNAACSQIGSATGMSFQFVEGAFVSALRNGHWILLDEVNLAPPETLQRIGAVLDGESGTLCLAERGDVDYIERHPCFRMFACMNPATDAGKRELPYTFRSRFTEFFVDDLIDDDDLRLFVGKYLDGLHAAKGVTNSIVQFYKAAKKESEEKLQDGANQKPQFSLRSLSRSLAYIKSAEKKFGFKKALYDGFCMFFLTMLDAPSAKIVNNLIVSLLLDGRLPPKISFADYFVEQPKLLNGSESDEFLRSYVLTNSVTEHIVNLARAVYIKKYPVLLQGPTSSGKTSLVRFLAAKSGHEFVRINNHEHTDLQEYLGTYVTDSHGKLQFQEGALVKAVREGHWIVLDELNLAPSDVLEALNRLLDDNRELFVPELQETIAAHPNFMLFATQNPPVLYGGRKMLSRAFRNRFIEMHVDEIPEDELITILEQRCAIACSYSTQMVQVMKDLQTHRQNSRVFAGKHGFITPRDLFRWANRYRLFEGKSYEDLAKDGYLLLAERLRDDNEKAVVQEALQRHLRVKLSISNLYNMIHMDVSGSRQEMKRLKPNYKVKQREYSLKMLIHKLQCDIMTCDAGTISITWTESMWRLFFLIERCYRSREPVLLVGETGGGKTTVCQVLSAVLGVKLHILNCHQYTETSDFIGGFCPIRDRSKIALEFKDLITKMKQMEIFIHVAGDMALPSDISGAMNVMNHINDILDRYRKDKELFPQVPPHDIGAMEQIRLDLMQLHKRWQAIFLWQDGSLVQAMKNGDLFLIDEISLADDSVLERLNSVLEPERKLSLAEKGGSVLEKVVAHPNFFILATMNPGGDYGKKELSPALRNRFTELWVPAVTDVDELKSIATERFTKAEVSCFGDCIVNFWMWFNQLHTGRMLTIRDLLSWISFINVTEGHLGPQQALIHGLFLILLDGLTLGMNVSKSEATELRRTCLSFLLEELQKVEGKPLNSDLNDLKNYGWGDHTREIDIGQPDYFGIRPFYIAKGHFACKQQGFEFMAPTTSKNVFRVLRGMQLPKPLLLEGSPGVGKTSLIVALAGFSGHNVVRINLSEQTDMMDLLGSDLPVEGDNGMEFAWSDGILLQALKNGSWVLLDELNLAPQSVLEGLNAILDHRAEVFIPELGQTYKCPSSFRVFACQNPSSQGGGRKGLPKSFLNRFTKVYVDELSEGDYSFICKSQYPSIKDDILKKLISFNNKLYMDTMIHKKYGQEGSPWEFNLRDIIRSCEMIAGACETVTGYPDTSKFDCFLNTVYLQRMRTVADRDEVVKLFEEVFQMKYSIFQTKMLDVNPQCLVVGSASIRRNRFHSCKVQNNQLNILPATDVSELLGCFEQYNFFRHYKVVISQVERYVDEYFSLSIDIHWKKLIAERKTLFTKWFEFVVARKCSSICTSTLIEMSKNSSLPSLGLISDIVDKMKCDLEMFDLPISFNKDDLSKTLRSIYYLQQSEAVHQPVKFEWVAGDLIRAIECGEWIVLDNANFCNPTVLDRINSLVEQERSIVVNECGLVDGNPVILKAHPKFRMFLTINSKHGEVSRAMRNRGVEICLMNQNLSIYGCRNAPEDSEKKDIMRFLISCGIPKMELVSSMSEAHLYAKAAGLRLGINITLLEITRWVQLFKQLLIKGNHFLWSLHLSWEHTYLPSLGEVNGSNIVEEGKLRFLVHFDGGSTDLQYGFSLSLPGGWPVEQKLKDFVWYSKETCVQRNCMYLQSLGSQYAAYQISTLKSSSSLLGPITSIHPYVLPATSLFELQFPTVSDLQSIKPCVTGLFNSELADQMLFIAANWVLEQSTENDLKLYAIWFKWYNHLLQPYCNFFETYGNILKQESDHPIWHSILECYREIVAYHKIDVAAHPIPLLSTKLLDMAFCVTLKDCHNRLRNSRNGLSLLRLTLQQWQSETKFPDHGIMKVTMLPALKSLRCLEDEVLKMVVKSRKLLQIYSRLLDYHRSIWKMILLSQFEGLPVVWNLLKKEVLKLQPKFPVEVGVFLMESINLNSLQDFNLHYDKPTLWVYGGHPIMPSSGRIFYKIQDILAFSAAVWPRKNILKGHFDDNQHLIDAMLSASQDLRNLAMEGLSMGSLAATITEQDDSTVLVQLDEVHKSIVEKVDWEKKHLELCSKSATVQVIANTEYLLKYAMDFSLGSSSRSPFEFTQHQIIWWIHQAWAKVDNAYKSAFKCYAVHIKVASSILEMWFNYHTFLWTYCSGKPKVQFPVTHDEACDLAHLTKMDAIDTILQEDLHVTDYEKNRLVLRISSRNIWEGVSFARNFVLSLHSAADSLFKQIIVAHKKHFKQEEYSKLESILFQQPENRVKKEDLDTACALLSCSSHGVLASLSGSHELVRSLLLELHSPVSQGHLMHLGSAWVYIGELRFRLLLSSYNPDPAFESAFMHSHILEKISLLELEGKVRHQCEELAGSSSAEDVYDQNLLQELKAKEKNIRAKVVFRPSQSKHKSLIAACYEFEERLSECKSLLNSLNGNGVGQLEVDRVCNWQITSRNFIKRLTDEYGEYVDLIKPIQVAVYEMKLGLAIALSGYLEREYLKKIKEDDIEQALGAVFALMQFPSVSVTANVSVDMPDLTKYGSDDQLGIRYSEANDLAMLKKLAAVSSQLNAGEVADKLRSHSQMLVSIHHISLVRTTYRVCYSLILDNTSYLLLKETFDQFTSMWIDMKTSLKAKENDDSQYYKFRSRIIDIHDIFKGNVPSLSDVDTEGNAVADTEEKLEQDFFKIMERTDENNGVAEDTWDLIPESILKCIVTIHNQLFGSPDLVEKPRKCQIRDDQIIQSFIDSYELGSRILKDLPELTSSTFDEKLMPEHLFRVCLEYRRTCASSLECNSYKTYQDPNPSVLFRMVEPLTALKEKVRHFLDEWPGHPGLLKILDILDSLLAMPLSTPLSKALLGLQLLVGKAQTLQENDSKFFFKDHLPPLFMIVSSWQKLELECWPILLEEVLGKYENNALKNILGLVQLWFPLRALLAQSCDISKNEELSIIKSVEEFVQTSSVGEFKRRLHLLLAFHGEIADAASVGAYSSSSLKKIQNILYNLFGYYMQFLPLILDQIEAGKVSIEKDLKDQVKLYRWEQDPHSTASIEKFKRTRQKIFKLLQRFNDILQKPVIVLLNQESTARKVPCWLDQQRPGSEFPVDTGKLSERFLWYTKWANQAKLSFQALQKTNVATIGVTNLSNNKEFMRVAFHNTNSRQDESELEDRLKFFWDAIERICNAADFGSILKHGKKNQKKTALSNLFKTLEECGLSKHRPMGHEWGNDLDASSPFLEQSYITTHLLQQATSQKIPEDSIAHATLLSTNNWKHANQQYFKCLAMMQQLRQISLKFNKDLGLEEVNRATSFMNHLLSMLSEQRHFAYNMFEQLNEFRHAIFLLGSGADSGFLSSRQSVLLNSMWQQKQFFDNILAMTMDTNLLLRSFMDCHRDPCDNVQVEVSAISSIFEKFVTRFSESKDLLDKYLLGSNNIITGSHKNMPLATTEMEQLVAANCQLISMFKEEIQVLCHQDISIRSVKKVLLSWFEELLEKVNLAMAILSREVEDKHMLSSDVLHNLEASYAETFKEILSLAIGIVGKLTDLGIPTDGNHDSLEGNITLWKNILQTYVTNLQMGHLCDGVKKLTVSVRGLVDIKPELCSSIELQLIHLHALLALVLSAAEGILSELLEAHKTTSEMTHALGDLLIYLFAEGFGSTDDTTEDASDGPQQDATGTGMGEGEGKESASSKIDDISQLEGTANEMDAQHKPDQAPKNDDEGIEMQEDFNAELSDVSEDPEGEDSGDDNDDMNLENQMGDTGDSSEMVGKKSWDKDKDDDPNTSTEKYESGSSVKETQKNDRDLRAKDEDAFEEDPMETDCEEQGKNNNLEDDPSTHEDVDQDTDDVMDKADAYDDRTGPELPEPNDDCEDVDMEGTDHVDEMDADGEELSPEEEKLADGSLDDSDDVDDGDAAQHGDTAIDGEQEHAEDVPMETNNMDKEQLQKVESLEHPSQGIQANNVDMDPNRESDSNLANSTDMNSAAAPVSYSSNEVPSLEISMPNSGDGSRLLSNSKPELQTDTPSQIKETNPFRSIGDAMEDWKERAKVSADTQDHQPEAEHHIDDESATEFRYVPDSEQSTSQALGNATADQINDDLRVKQTSIEDENHVQKEEHNTERTPADDHSLEVPHLQASQSHTNKSENANNFEHREIQTDTSVQDSVLGETDNAFGDFVSFKRPPADERTILSDNLANGRELSTQMEIDITDEDMKGATIDWKSVELTTMKLSQELAEQLRLVMEPTLASKLQGDYRTGKRINMKKVIPYIASHFRRDKIWLRRTKPNKRNYQVVIAVDDSRSMSEGKCGKVAIEALVTVCRAMSQLEVGQFAVASFGKKGNVKVLHDFDQVFNGEAGMNMISSLSFEQDNKLEDEPVADLLMHLNTMLDTAVARSRTPSGNNPLQQFVLIISDGKFHEKENLKRCVRNVLNKKRMIAYVLLDSHEESIMDSLEVSYQGAKLTMGKYMDSFPFPYYVMLKNIEALPRTLADLLRQWFELMQSANE